MGTPADRTFGNETPGIATARDTLITITPTVTAPPEPTETSTPSVTQIPNVTLTPTLALIESPTPSVTQIPNVTLTPTLALIESPTPSVTGTSAKTPVPTLPSIPSVSREMNTYNGPGLAPVNPEFLEYQKQLQLSGTKKTMTRQTVTDLTGKPSTRLFSLGEIPGTVDLSHTRGQLITPDSASATVHNAGPDGHATSFDLRTSGKVSPVKDQTYFGTCWAFATFGSLESTLIPVNPTPDFSEKNLANLAGFDLAIP
ncbi:MAG: C1 family peptidase, partial [Methanoregula sp.]|nr:C1 family peptidase [Methanoregula sp.]